MTHALVFIITMFLLTVTFLHLSERTEAKGEERLQTDSG